MAALEVAGGEALRLRPLPVAPDYTVHAHTLAQPRLLLLQHQGKQHAFRICDANDDGFGEYLPLTRSFIPLPDIRPYIHLHED